MRDGYKRNINYMRISVTDRCNLRCMFCMPKENNIRYLSREKILSYEQIETIVLEAVALGITHFRITGGEPLVRKNIEDLVTSIKAIPKVESVTMTTNGILLSDKIDRLIQAGIDGINISLSSMDREVYKQITGYDGLNEALDGIRLAYDKGINVKVNCVPMPNINSQGLEQVALLAKDKNIAVRFIEMMPIGEGSNYHMIKNEDLLDRFEKNFGKAKLSDEYLSNNIGNGPAVYYQFPDFQGNIGFISARSCRFCERCNRVRLTADGRLKLCLQYEESVDLKSILQEKKTLRQVMEQAIRRKPKQHDFDNQIIDKNIDDIEKNNMNQIGG